MAEFLVDTHTILFLLFLSNITTVAILVAYNIGKVQKKPYIEFIVGTIFLSVSWILLSLRDQIPDIVSVHGGNTLILAGVALQVLAIVSIGKKDQNVEKLFLLLAAGNQPFGLPASWFYS